MPNAGVLNFIDALTLNVQLPFIAIPPLSIQFNGGVDRYMQLGIASHSRVRL